MKLISSDSFQVPKSNLFLSPLINEINFFLALKGRKYEFFFKEYCHITDPMLNGPHASWSLCVVRWFLWRVF